MKIGISCYPTFGGSGVVATELAMALAAKGDEVHVVSFAPPSRLTLPSRGVFYHEVVVPQYPLFQYSPYSLALATKMVEVVRHHGIELIHVHYAVPNAVSAILARQIVAPQSLPVVTTLHGTDITLVGNDPSYLETTRYGILQSDAVTAVSDFLAEATEEQLGIDRGMKNIEVIPNFIDPLRYERVRKGPGARRWSRPGERILVHISNFRPVKRVDDVVEIHRRLRQQDLPVRLLLVGDGPERPRIERECRQRGGCDDITFLGNLSPVEEVLAGADLFVLPSETESFGLSALEALACEVPVIASRVGGLPEVVQEGVCGRLLPVGDVEGMTEAARELLTDEEQRREMGIAGRRRAIREFHVTRVMERYRNVYRQVISL